MRISAAVEDVDWGLDENDQKNPQAKGKGNNDLVVPFDHIPPEQSNISLGDDMKLSQRPIQIEEENFDLSAIKLHRRQHPEYTDQQVRELMKGKSVADRKRFLKEIEDERQRNLEIQFTLERQRLLNDERWARRNIQDR